jgi:hypothetical protein
MCWDGVGRKEVEANYLILKAVGEGSHKYIALSAPLAVSPERWCFLEWK